MAGMGGARRERARRHRETFAMPGRQEAFPSRGFCNFAALVTPNANALRPGGGDAPKYDRCGARQARASAWRRGVSAALETRLPDPPGRRERWESTFPSGRRPPAARRCHRRGSRRQKGCDMSARAHSRPHHRQRLGRRMRRRPAGHANLDCPEPPGWRRKPSSVRLDEIALAPPVNDRQVPRSGLREARRREGDRVGPRLALGGTGRNLAEGEQTGAVLDWSA
jgi:hypothetical protein